MKLSPTEKRKITSRALEYIEYATGANIDTTNLYLFKEHIPVPDFLNDTDKNYPFKNFRSFENVQDVSYMLVDMEPEYNWGHSCQHMLFNSESAEMQGLQPHLFPPRSYFIQRETYADVHHPVELSYKKDPDKEVMLKSALSNISGKRYAVLFSGLTEYRHLNDLEFLYRVLINTYEFEPENIFVLNYDGTLNYSGKSKKPPFWPGDDTPYRMKVTGAGTKDDLIHTFEKLKTQMNKNDFLFIHTNGHGVTYKTEAALGTYDFNFFYANEFTEKLQEIEQISTLMVMMQQCFSGGFSDPLLTSAVANKVHFASSCRGDKPSMGGSHFNPFSLEWITGISGYTADGRDVRDLIDAAVQDKLTANRAFSYALSNKNPKDTPLFAEYPRGIGDHIYLGQDTLRKELQKHQWQKI